MGQCKKGGRQKSLSEKNKYFIFEAREKIETVISQNSLQWLLFPSAGALPRSSLICNPGTHPEHKDREAQDSCRTKVSPITWCEALCELVYIPPWQDQFSCIGLNGRLLLHPTSLSVSSDTPQIHNNTHHTHTFQVQRERANASPFCF